MKGSLEDSRNRRSSTPHTGRNDLRRVYQEQGFDSLLLHRQLVVDPISLEGGDEDNKC